MPADVENQTPAAQSQSLATEETTEHGGFKRNDNAPFSDGQSAKIWQPYLRIADKYDNDLVKGWQDDMDTVLIFASLFSATVTPFVIESYQSLKEDSSEVMINVLLQISQQLANGTNSTAASRSSSFQPSPSSVTINTLWFLSLVFSLACSLAAVMVRQWARRYLRTPRGGSTTADRARNKQLIFESMQRWRQDVIVEAIPLLLHVSLMLFFIGLLLYLQIANSQVANHILCFSLVSGGTYVAMSLTPLISPWCPYWTPFTPLLLASSPVMSKRVFRSLASPLAYGRFLKRMYTSLIRSVRVMLQRNAIESDSLEMRALARLGQYCSTREEFKAVVTAIPAFLKPERTDVISDNNKMESDFAANIRIDEQYMLWGSPIVKRIIESINSEVDSDSDGLIPACVEALHWLARCPMKVAHSSGLEKSYQLLPAPLNSG